MRVIRIEFIFGSLIATGTATIDTTSPKRITISFNWEPSVICSNNYTANKQADAREETNENVLSSKCTNNCGFHSEVLHYQSNLIIFKYYGKKLFFSSRNMSNGAVPFLGGRSPPQANFILKTAARTQKSEYRMIKDNYLLFMVT